MDVKKSQTKFTCEECNFFSNNKTDYDRHILTQKHKNKLKIISNKFICDCGACYKYRQGLWKHQQKCGNLKIKNIEENLQDEIDKKNNQINQLMELVNNKCNNITNNTINQTNNINLFLNTHCPDALNLSEFIELIQNNISQYLPSPDVLLENNLEDNITVVINKNYKIIDTDKKPYYLMDNKRNKLIVKDNNEWINMSPEDQKLQKSIESCERSISKEIQKNFQENHPNFLENELEQEKFIEVLNHSTTDIGNIERKKIIKAMCKEGINTKEIKDK